MATEHLNLPFPGIKEARVGVLREPSPSGLIGVCVMLVAVRSRKIDESLKLGEAIDYAAVTGLSNEARQRLAAAKPATIGQANGHTTYRAAATAPAPSMAAISRTPRHRLCQVDRDAIIASQPKRAR